MKRITGRKPEMCIAALLFAAAVLAAAEVDIEGAVEWDAMEISASVSLDLASAGIKLPSGRLQGQAIVEGEYLRLLRPAILSLPVDSSSTLEDLIRRGEYSLAQAENLALGARTVPPSLSADLSTMLSRYFLSLSGLSAELIRHSRQAEIPHALAAASVPAYTGIIIIAAEELPVHGTNRRERPLPCLFPKIWDTDMNLIYERNMLDPSLKTMVRYAPQSAVFRETPSGLSGEIAGLVGANPLRILARGIFGKRPADCIIDREDSLVIISSESNRRLLSEGRVVIVLDDRDLKSPLVP
ncbi:MAG: polymerase [Treponema sp.]|nr:polymerase [Treponema sp.]